MPVREADPWRLQYFADAACPDGVDVPTEDADAWEWYPCYRWVYDKLRVAQSQGFEAAPHGVMPAGFPVFSKPIVNLRGMGVGSRVIGSADEYAAAWTAGHFWMRLLTGEHVSSDVAVVDGRAVWWRHATGIPGAGGIFDRWIVHAAGRPGLEAACGAWIARHLGGYSGMLNLETIGGGIIEVHLRFADQWPDLYGAGWVAALIRLYAEGRWVFDDARRRDGYSVVLFGPPGAVLGASAGGVGGRGARDGGGVERAGDVPCGEGGGFACDAAGWVSAGDCELLGPGGGAGGAGAAGGLVRGGGGGVSGRLGYLF